MHKICVLPGDGVGPEVTRETLKVFQALSETTGWQVQFDTGYIGGDAIDHCDDALPEDTLAKISECDAVLLGAVGGPKWDDQPPEKRPETGLLRLRKNMKLNINLRPMKIFPALKSMSPLAKIASGEMIPDIMIVRELSSGIYFGKPRYRKEGDDGLYAVDSMTYTQSEIQRVADVAFRIAANRNRELMSVDKANVLETSRLWRETVQQLASEYPTVEVKHMFVDNCAMQIVSNPEQFDVLVTSNMFGDILSDLASVLPGSIGLMPSASLGDEAIGMFEPVHGSAPDIAGKGIVNPIATILSGAMLLRDGLGMDTEASMVEKAVDQALEEGYRTKDIGSHEDRLISTGEMGDLIADHIKQGN